MSKLIKMVALILGGGQGTRLYPLTEQRSKPAVPIGAKYRLIDIPISNCIHAGIKRMFVLTQFNSASLNQHIKNTYQFDPFSNGFVDILAAEQTPSNKTWFQGTADAVRQSFHHLLNHDFDLVMVLSGDQLYQMNLKAMAEYHVQQKATLTIATIPVNAKEAPGFGIMKVSKEGFIDRFIEKPNSELLPDWKSETGREHKRKGLHWLASMGIYIFNKQTIIDLLTQNPQATDFGKEIIPAAIQRGEPVASYMFDGYWTDIGTISSFFEANLALTDPLPRFNLFDNVNKIYTRARMLPPVKISNSRISRSIIGDGSIVHARSIQHSLVGVRARIGKGTQLNQCIVMGNDFYQKLEEVIKPDEIPMGIGENCDISHAILDKNCRVGHNVVIKGNASLADADFPNYAIVDGIVVVKKGAIVPSGARIGAV